MSSEIHEGEIYTRTPWFVLLISVSIIFLLSLWSVGYNYLFAFGIFSVDILLGFIHANGKKQLAESHLWLKKRLSNWNVTRFEKDPLRDT